MKCSGNSKAVKRKALTSRDASLERESRSLSRSTCSQTRELTRANVYECRPSLKNLEKLDLMPERERELRGVNNSGRAGDGDDV